MRSNLNHYNVIHGKIALSENNYMNVFSNGLYYFPLSIPSCYINLFQILWHVNNSSLAATVQAQVLEGGDNEVFGLVHRRLISVVGCVNRFFTYQRALWMTLWHFTFKSQMHFLTVLEDILERCCCFMIFLWAMKNATNGSCIPKVEALASHGEKKKGSTVTHFQKELMVLKGSQFYKHIPSLSVWLVKHFLCLCLSVNADALCQKVFPHENILFPGWGTSCPSPPRISSSHSKCLHCSACLIKSLWYRLNRYLLAHFSPFTPFE